LDRAKEQVCSPFLGISKSSGVANATATSCLEKIRGSLFPPEPLSKTVNQKP
jgi:hypothetical protein